MYDGIVERARTFYHGYLTKYGKSSLQEFGLNEEDIVMDLLVDHEASIRKTLIDNLAAMKREAGSDPVSPQ